MSSSRVVIGVIGDDIHIVGNRIMQLALEECGFSVYNLCTRHRPERFVQAALRSKCERRICLLIKLRRGILVFRSPQALL